MGSEPNPVAWYAGRQYDADVAHAKLVLKQLEEFYPGYQGQGYEISGFVWWQGNVAAIGASHGSVAPAQQLVLGLIANLAHVYCNTRIATFAPTGAKVTS